MTPSPKYQRVRRLGATAALAAGLFAGGISVASAATHTHRGQLGAWVGCDQLGRALALALARPR